MLSQIINILKKIWKTIIALLRWYKGLYQGRAWYTKTALGVVSFIVSIFIFLGMVDINFLWLFGSSPGFKEIKTPPTFDASLIYSSDSVLIGKFYEENRIPVEYEDVAPEFWNALIDTEDERFYSHHGIDPAGIAGAVKDALMQRGGRGASTITQQLAKNLFHMRQKNSGLLCKIPGLRMLIVKSKEWIIAMKLEYVYEKNEILTMYANTVGFGNNAFGINTAAKTYFNTIPAKLTTDQAAILVGMLKATTTYNPILHPENSFKRRNVVLNNMVEHGHLSREEFYKLRDLPIKLDVQVENHYEGMASYFREYIKVELKDWYTKNDYDLCTSGLKIYTTLDTRMQKYAEQAALKQMRQVQHNFNNHWGKEEPWRDENGQLVPDFIEEIARRQPVYKSLMEKFPNQPDSISYYLNKPHKVTVFDYEKGQIEKEMSTMDSIRYMVRFMHCGFVAMEPETGAVRAWVGDVDFSSWKYDKVTAMRQPGSTFKLFVYTEAMNQGLTPCDKRRDEFISMEVVDKKTGLTHTWAPTNANGQFSGDSIPLRTAFAKSINSVAVRLGQEMGIRNIIKTAQDMGIKSPLEDEPSLTLGSCDVNLLEMVNAYSTVATGGMHHAPVVITRILDRDDNVVYEGPDDEHQVLPYKTAYLMQEMLKAGTHDGGGTSVSLMGYVTGDTDWGGKTGTSNNHSDAWFIGVSPHLVVGAWVGGEYRCIHFRTGALGQGSRTALPICGYFLQSVMRDGKYKRYHGRFDRPSNAITPDMYDCMYTPMVEVADSDSIDIDIDYSDEYKREAEGLIDQMQQTDENGNPTNTPKSEQQEQRQLPNRPKEQSTNPKEETVTFDNL